MPARRATRLRRDVPAVAASVLAAALLGSAALLLVARWSARPAVFVPAGLGVAALAAGLAVRRVLRRRPGAAARRAGVVTAVVTTGLMATTWLVPLHDPPAALDQPPVRYWSLATGSRLAYLRVAASGPARRPWPVVVLHGGPGVPDLAGDQRLWGRLAADGFDVYVYAQLGAGRSTRATDPAAYGTDRDVGDLDQIRLRLHADRLVLIGHSYGGTLAAAYLAAHPTHVARLVLTSPGPLDPADHSAGRATARLGVGRRLALYRLTLAPRALLGYTLLQVNPRAAHAFLPDAEADDRNDRVLTAAQAGLHCQPGARPRVSGSGFYRLQYPQSATAPPARDLRPALTGLPVPTLVIKGRCDYLSWAAAEDYRRALPRTTLVYLPAAGHNVHQDQPGAVLTTTRAFLTDRPLPLPRYSAMTAPPDYQGPR